MAKRKKKVRRPPIKPPKRKLRYYPVIFCTGENIAIAVSFLDIRVKFNKNNVRKSKEKVSSKHWITEGQSQFREGYEIDFNKLNVGYVVRCPKCKAEVDFRLFPSSTKPKMVDVQNQYYRFEKFPNT